MADGYANECDVTTHRPMEERAAAEGHLTSQSAAACVEHLRWGGAGRGVGGWGCGLSWKGREKRGGRQGWGRALIESSGLPESGDLRSKPERKDEELFGQTVKRQARVSSSVTWAWPLCLFPSWNGCEDQVSSWIG